MSEVEAIDDRRRIEAAIALKVPRLSRDEHEASVQDCIRSARRGGWRQIEHKPYRTPS
jgi:hypothetical protein